MSTSVELRPKVAAGGYGSPLDIRTRLAIGVGLLLGLTPLLIVHVRQMWSQSHYQYFPFVLAAVAWFLWSRWKEGAGTVGPRAGAAWRTEIAVAAISLAALGLGVLLYNPWLSACSAILSVAVGFLMLSRLRKIRGLWGIWCLLWLCVPLPLGFGSGLTASLQLMSSRLSSELLDLIGVNHLMSGNILQLPGQQLFVDEACSGIVSVLAVVACAAMFAVWARRPLLHALVLIVSGIGWAVVMNVVRICTIAFALDRFEIDLSHGTPHEVLGLVVFCLTFVAVVSTDQLLTFVLEPVPVTDLYRDEAAWNPLVGVWNRLFDTSPHEPEQAGESGARSSKELRVPLRVRRAILGFAGAFAVLGICQLGGELWASNSPTVLGYDVAQAIQEDLLQERVGDWQRIGFEDVHREVNDAFGEYSKLFTYRNGVTNQQATVSVDYPFLRGWHELTACYRGAGWELTDRGVRAAKSGDGKQNWNYVQAEFEKPGGEFGFLTYTFIDSLGNRISPPVDELWEKLIERVRRRGPYSLGSRYYQLQAWTAGSGQIDDAGKAAVQELFLICRERFRDHFANAMENK